MIKPFEIKNMRETRNWKPNVIFAGEPDQEDVEDFMRFEHLVVINCDNPEQVRKMLREGKADFNVFGEPAE